MKYQHYPMPLIAMAGTLAILGLQTLAAGALVAAGLFAVADALQRKE